MTTIETATHRFWVKPSWAMDNCFEAAFRPLNPKTGKPWQSSHRITDGADAGPPGWEGRRSFYSTEAKAVEAMNRKVAQMRKR